MKSYVRHVRWGFELDGFMRGTGVGWDTRVAVPFINASTATESFEVLCIDDSLAAKMEGNDYLSFGIAILALRYSLA